MLAILNFSNAHNLPIFQPILILVSKFMVHRALSDKTYLSFGLMSPLSLSDVVFMMLINVKMPAIVGILTFRSRINFVHS